MPFELTLANRLMKAERVRRNMLRYGRNKNTKVILDRMVKVARNEMTQESWVIYREIKKILKLIQV